MVERSIVVQDLVLINFPLCGFAEPRRRSKESTELDLLHDRILSTAAYGTELEHAQATTLRLKLVKMAARVSVTARRVFIRFTSSHPSRAIFEHAAERLRQLRLTPE